MDIPHDSFPPTDAIVIEPGDRRVLLLHGAQTAHITLAVWTRRVVKIDPTILGGWICDPTSGLSLSKDGARALMIALGEALR